MLATWDARMGIVFQVLPVLSKGLQRLRRLQRRRGRPPKLARSYCSASPSHRLLSSHPGNLATARCTASNTSTRATFGCRRPSLWSISASCLSELMRSPRPWAACQRPPHRLRDSSPLPRLPWLPAEPLLGFDKRQLRSCFPSCFRASKYEFASFGD